MRFYMKEERVNLFAKLSDDEKMALTSNDFTISEITEIINETALNKLDKNIAIMRYIKKMTFDEISIKLNRDVRTIQKRLVNISIKLKSTCVKLFIK